MRLVKLNDIFDIQYGNSLSLQAQEPGEIAFVARGSENNGIVSYISYVDNIPPFDGGSITVALGGSVLESFYQDNPFYTSYHVSVLIPKIAFSTKILLAYCTTIRSNKYRFSYGRQANKTLGQIKVPDPNEIKKLIKNFDIPEPPTKICLSNNKVFLTKTTWKQFKYEDLFDIQRGQGPRQKDIISGNVPFITSINSNNGLSGFTNCIAKHKGNSICVNRNGSVGESFYQPVDFCSTEDVHVFTLKPTFNAHMNVFTGLFISTLIRKEKYRFNYGRKWGIDRMKKSIITLPVNKSGLPDWKFMEDYIKSLPFSSDL